MSGGPAERPSVRGPLSARDLLLGIDVGGTKCVAVIGTRSGSIIERREWESRAGEGPKPMIRRIADAARALMDRTGGVVACGVSMPGPLDVERGVIEDPPNLPGWHDVPLREVLEREIGLPIRIEHDAVACALAEARWGRGGAARRLVYLTCGTGFGMGLLIDGEPFYGAHGRPPEIGHLRLHDDGPIAFGRRGSVEAFCAAPALGRIAVWKFPARWPTSARPEEVASLASGGDAEARAVVATNARATGEACALVADLLHPDLIVLGSLARYLGPDWVDAVRASFAGEALPGAASSCRIVPSGLGERVQDLSAVAVAVRDLETRRR